VTTKTLCIYSSIFLALTAACNLLYNIISLQLGELTIFLDSFIGWFFVLTFVGFIAQILVLRYFQTSKYWFAFFAGAIATITNLCFTADTYAILVLRQFASYYLPLLFIYLSATAISGISLIFSATAKSSWLKLAGIYILVISLILISATIWRMVAVNSTLSKIAQWASVLGGLTPILFMMHFLGEIKALKTTNTERPTNTFLEYICFIVAAVALTFTITFAILIADEGYMQLYWRTQNAKDINQFAKLCETRIFVGKKGDTLHYLLLKPLHYDARKTYPLVISLPAGGYGGSAAIWLSTASNRKEFPAFVFVPFCPEVIGTPNYPPIDSLFFGAISALNKEPGIDIKRRYITGVSRGGYGTWHFICTRPDLFAAAIPVCGGGDTKLAQKIVNMPVWAFHGSADRNVLVSESRNMIAAIKKAGGNPKYTEFPGETHGIWYIVSTKPGLWDWLFAQKRN